MRRFCFSRASLASSSPLSSIRTFSSRPLRVCVAEGDGVGPEITDATVRLLRAAGVNLDIANVVVGEKAYLRGVMSGIDTDAWKVLEDRPLMLKGPITTPLGKGYKSVNVSLRKTLGLFANVRPVFSYAPYVKALHPKMDLVIIRENEEDLYAGIEHRHTAEVLQCIKLISIPGCERIIRYAFEYCRQQQRKRLTCVTKSNIMKLTDGAFQNVFEQMATQYPDIQSDHQIVDIATARLASRPQNYDVVVTLNLYGDIMSDVAAEVAGSVGMAGSANIGSTAAMFEAVHGSAPDIAGKNIANPSGLMNAAIMMLNYARLHQDATNIHNAMLVALEEGIHTQDIAGPSTTKLVGTKEFADECIARLGRSPVHLKPVDYVTRNETHGRKNVDPPNFVVPEMPRRPIPDKKYVGTDVFIDYDPQSRPLTEPPRSADRLAKILEKCAGEHFKLSMISNRGVVVWPNGHPSTYKVDHWRCRFQVNGEVKPNELLPLLKRLGEEGVEVIKTENLYFFDGEPGFSKGQGQ